MDRLIDSGLEELSAAPYEMGELTYHAASATPRERVKGVSAYDEIREVSKNT